MGHNSIERIENHVVESKCNGANADTDADETGVKDDLIVIVFEIEETSGKTIETRSAAMGGEMHPHPKSDVGSMPHKAFAVSVEKAATPNAGDSAIAPAFKELLGDTAEALLSKQYSQNCCVETLVVLKKCVVPTPIEWSKTTPDTYGEIARHNEKDEIVATTD